MYNLPSKREENKDEHDVILKLYDEAYDLGYNAAERKMDLVKDNPYTPSGHERDTTLQDELHYQWYCGFSDFGYEDE